MLTEPDGVLGVALAYARRGWPVFPCKPGGKEPATRHGFRDASTDPGLIRYWWSRQPDANLAIATGAPGPDVLDVDQHGPAGNGFAAYYQLDVAGLLDGALAIVATPRGGLHAYFAGTGQASRRLVRHHLDLRATGGYVVAPPSQVSGRRYRLIRHRAQGGVLDWAAVTGMIEPRAGRPARYRTATPGDAGRLVGWVAQLEEGNRNGGLFWAACRVIEADQEPLLYDLATAAAATGLPSREIERTIASARRSARKSNVAEA